MNELMEILWEMNPEVDFATATALVDDGILDSFDMICLAAELDVRFGVILSAEDMVPENFNSAQAIYALIRRLRNS